jgi:hypothetical protein
MEFFQKRCNVQSLMTRGFAHGLQKEEAVMETAVELAEDISSLLASRADEVYFYDYFKSNVPRVLRIYGTLAYTYIGYIFASTARESSGTVLLCSHARVDRE